MDRRRFLLTGAGALATTALTPLLPPEIADSPGGAASVLARVDGWINAVARAADAPAPLLTVAHGPSPARITRAAIDALGGISRFVPKGARVVVKPNIGWDRTPEQAANTNPEVVAEIIRMALEAGAKSVLVLDNPCNDPRRCYERSGIAAAVRGAGGTIDFFEESRCRKMKLGGDRLKEWEVHPAVIEADVRINVPVAKHHGLADLTLGMKNWMGSVGGARGRMHQDIDTCVVDLAAFFRPQLTIIDGVRILTRGGPQGGSLGDVKRLDTVIASGDPVAAEARGIALHGQEAARHRHVALAAGRGLGRSTWSAEEERLLEVPGA